MKNWTKYGLVIFSILVLFILIGILYEIVPYSFQRNSYLILYDFQINMSEGIYFSVGQGDCEEQLKNLVDNPEEYDTCYLTYVASYGDDAWLDRADCECYGSISESS